jgi:hypothetical protein
LLLLVRLSDQSVDHSLAEKDFTLSPVDPGTALCICESPEDGIPAEDVSAGEEDA